jgi:hypothetical protein
LDSQQKNSAELEVLYAKIDNCYWIAGMSTSTVDHLATAVSVRTDDEQLTVELSDGRVLSVPIAWYPRLLHGSTTERNTWRLIATGHGIHWPALDEDISVENLLAGKPSGESQASFKRWLESRLAPS